MLIRALEGPSGGALSLPSLSTPAFVAFFLLMAAAFCSLPLTIGTHRVRSMPWLTWCWPRIVAMMAGPHRFAFEPGPAEPPDGGAIQIGLQVEDDRRTATLAVSDRWVGIPADQIKQIFEGFVRAPSLPGRDPGGLGLGLFISREIVERQGGRIWAESNAGSGATFRVRLPLQISEGDGDGPHSGD